MMHFEINRKDFIEALSIGGAMAGKTKSIMILDYAKVLIKNNQMIVSSADDDVYVTKTVFIQSHDDDITFCVCTSELIKALKMLKDLSISATVNIDCLNIKHEKGRMRFNIVSADNFPTMKKSEDCKEFNLKSEEFFGMIDLARRFTATDTLRPIMCGVLMYIQDNRFGVCASDGHKLFTDSIELSESNGDVLSIIPSKACQSILNTVNGNEYVKISISDRNIIFAVNNARISCRLIDGRYPNFHSVIPTDNNNEVYVDRSELNASINRASLFSNPSSQLLSFDVRNTEMNICAEDIDFNRGSKETLLVKHSGEDITIGLKYDIAALCISCVDSNNITIKMSSPEKAIIYTDDSNPYRVILQMPMMLNQ